MLQGDVGKDVVEEETPSPKETDENPPSGSQLPMLHDSMVTVRLSEPPTLTVDTRTNILAASKLRVASTPISPSKRDFDQSSPSPSPNSENTKENKIDDVQGNLEVREEEDSPQITMVDPNGNELVSPMSPVGMEYQSFPDGDAKRDSDVSEGSEAGEVNWEELEKTEEKEPRSESSDDVSTEVVAGRALLTTLSRPRYCWQDSSRKTICWSRIQNPALPKCKLSKRSEIGGCLDHLPCNT